MEQLRLQVSENSSEIPEMIKSHRVLYPLGDKPESQCSHLDLRKLPRVHLLVHRIVKDFSCLRRLEAFIAIPILVK